MGIKTGCFLCLKRAQIPVEKGAFSFFLHLGKVYE